MTNQERQAIEARLCKAWPLKDSEARAYIAVLLCENRKQQLEIRRLKDEVLPEIEDRAIAAEDANREKGE